MTIDVESVVNQADSVEYLLQHLGRPRALQRAVAVRERAAAALQGSGWSHARFLAGSTTIDRLIDAGRAAEAVPLARRLLAEAMAAGEAAYERRGLRPGDVPLPSRPGVEAQRRGAGRAGPPRRGPHAVPAARGRGQPSSRTYGLGLPRASEPMPYRHWAGSTRRPRRTRKPSSSHEQRGDPRAVAVNRFQLGSVRLLQGRYPEALQAYDEARQTFERLGEPATVALAWHQIGMVFRRIGSMTRPRRPT